MSDAGAQFIRDEVHAREVWMDSRLAELDEHELATLRAATVIIDRMVGVQESGAHAPSSRTTTPVTPVAAQA